MISDVLSDALASIEEYQGSLPGSYDDFHDEIEEAKLAMSWLLIKLDTPPETTPEMWAEGMTRLVDTDPMRLKSLMANKVYHVRRGQVAEALGHDHPLLVCLLKAEEAVVDREDGTRRCAGGVHRPDAPGVRPGLRPGDPHAQAGLVRGRQTALSPGTPWGAIFGSPTGPINEIGPTS